ncbi:hypothetical protein HPB48_012285 [Haemaphysalis longicornis]|uniref:BRISC and BRCA1-A complex member 2 n=1 Tax=Haemaphysalis longicornis TaxID=44386 RepID=A0A9J6GLC0_HAELO|nr:hypothetical protein HPB48_012285 [Haemaphysalis longicornis]
MFLLIQCRRNSSSLTHSSTKQSDPNERDGSAIVCSDLHLFRSTGEVIFNAHRPELPPDFIFDDSSFQPDIEELPSLCEWNHEDDSALTNVIQELLEQYRKHQVSMLDSSPRLQFEYSSLVHQSDIAESNIQVHANWKNPGSPVRHRVAFSPLQENLSQDTAILQVTFQNPDGTRILPQLFLVAKCRVLGVSSVMALKLPPFNKDSCLMDYVPQVKELLEKKVGTLPVSASFQRRKEYVAAFLALFAWKRARVRCRGILRACLFFFEHENFFFILSIAIPRSFPLDKPSLTFQSAYHTSCGWPYSITCTDYPYSPRWEATEMADRARSFVMEYVPSFRSSSVKNR